MDALFFIGGGTLCLLAITSGGPWWLVVLGMIGLPLCLFVATAFKAQ